MQNDTTNHVTRTPPADPADAAAYFGRRFRFETDCWDVHSTQGKKDRGFMLLDVRSAELYERGHLPGARHLPHWEMNEQRLAHFPPDTLFVVYCAGPHCNAAQKAALRLTQMGRFAKEMIGGVEGWKDEGFKLSRSPSAVGV
ncbi:MAG: rhodanese-like domain-containing protein [Planctomycetota bacterium]